LIAARARPYWQGSIFIEKMESWILLKIWHEISLWLNPDVREQLSFL
jgi:hypothetical protein